MGGDAADRAVIREQDYYNGEVVLVRRERNYHGFAVQAEGFDSGDPAVTLPLTAGEALTLACEIVARLDPSQDDMLWNVVGEVAEAQRAMAALREGVWAS